MASSTSTLAEASPAPMYRYITRIPGVRGGNAIIEDTRVGVHDVIGLLQNGETIDTITVHCFPHTSDTFDFTERNTVDPCIRLEMSALEMSECTVSGNC